MGCIVFKLFLDFYIFFIFTRPLNNNNNNGRNGSCLTWLATPLEDKRRWLIINASDEGKPFQSPGRMKNSSYYIAHGTDQCIYVLKEIIDLYMYVCMYVCMYNLYFRLRNTEQHSHTVLGSIGNL